MKTKRKLKLCQWMRYSNHDERSLTYAVTAHQSTVQRWLKGTMPNIDHLFELSDVFGTSINNLFKKP